MKRTLEAAAKLRNAHIVPIPLDGKRPILASWQKLTLDEITRDWLSHQFGNGTTNIGALCGAASDNLLVFDFDGMAGYEGFKELFPDLADTLTVATGSGNGMHVYYRAETLPKSTGQLSVPGGHVEIKANGRQVVVPPSIHPDTGALYEVHHHTDIKPLSEANLKRLQEWIAEHNEADRTYAPPPEDYQQSQTAHRKYAEAALNNEASLLALVTSGSRNEQLNKAAFALGQLVGAGHLMSDEVKRALFQACQQNGLIKDDGVRAFESTFESGLRNGQGQPRYIQPLQNQRPSLPGRPAYEPPLQAIEEKGVLTVGRTRIIKRTSLFTELQRRINDDDYAPPVPPIPFPLSCMHYMGGQARVTKPGKLIAFVGASGSGKTSALETLADHYVAARVPVAIWTPEWSPDEMAERALQRYGGPTQDDLYLHEIAKWQGSQGLEYDYRNLLPETSRTNASLAMRTIRGWESEVSYVDNSMMTVAEMAEVIAGIQNNPEFMPRVLIVDYVQLLKANEADTDDSSMYNMVQRFKSLCVYYGLVGIMATQTRKDDAERNINPGQFKGTTILNCTKNSRGSKGHVRIYYDPDKLRIQDMSHPNQVVSENTNLLGSQAGRWMNDDAFNLWITLNPEYAEYETDVYT